MKKVAVILIGVAVLYIVSNINQKKPNKQLKK